MAHSTQLTLTRRQVRTMLDAVKKEKHDVEVADPDTVPDRADRLRDLEQARRMLSNAMCRIQDAEAASERRRPSVLAGVRR